MNKTTFRNSLQSTSIKYQRTSYSCRPILQTLKISIVQLYTSACLVHCTKVLAQFRYSKSGFFYIIIIKKINLFHHEQSTSKFRIDMNWRSRLSSHQWAYAQGCNVQDPSTFPFSRGEPALRLYHILTRRVSSTLCPINTSRRNIYFNHMVSLL